MSASTDLQSVSPSPPSLNLDSASRKILGPTGNREHVKKDESFNNKKKIEAETKKPNGSVKTVVGKNDETVESSCSLKPVSSNGGGCVKIGGLKSGEKCSGNRLRFVVDDAPVMVLTIPFKRCDWITQFSGMMVKFFNLHI